MGRHRKNTRIHQFLRRGAQNAQEVLVQLQLLDCHDRGDDCAGVRVVRAVLVAYQSVGSAGSDVEPGGRSYFAAFSSESGNYGVRLVVGGFLMIGVLGQIISEEIDPLGGSWRFWGLDGQVIWCPPRDMIGNDSLLRGSKLEGRNGKGDLEFIHMTMTVKKEIV